MKSFLLYLYAESPLHAGAPETDDGLDLPIQREAGSSYPVVWGQSLKGALRRVVGAFADPTVVTRAFGPNPQDQKADPGQGVLSIGDAQLVAMPVPTLQHSFAWATSGLALGRLARKYQRMRSSEPLPAGCFPDGTAGIASHAWLPGKGESKQHVIGPCLVPFSAGDDDGAAVRGWADLLARGALGDSGSSTDAMAYFGRKLREDLLVLGEDAMSFVLRECTEHAVRVQLETDTKKVENGPFTSEYLPAETLLAATITLRNDNDQDVTGALTNALHEQAWQLGGDTTIGKGWVWSRLIGGTQ